MNPSDRVVVGLPVLSVPIRQTRLDRNFPELRICRSGRMLPTSRVRSVIAVLTSTHSQRVAFTSPLLSRVFVLPLSLLRSAHFCSSSTTRCQSVLFAWCRVAYDLPLSAGFNFAIRKALEPVPPFVLVCLQSLTAVA